MKKCVFFLCVYSDSVCCASPVLLLLFSHFGASVLCLVYLCCLVAFSPCCFCFDNFAVGTSRFSYMGEEFLVSRRVLDCLGGVDVCRFSP